MSANSFGEHLVLTSFGESHGAALGAVVDGCPAGIPLDVESFFHALRRRRPGQSAVSSPRSEEDVPEVLSGVFEGMTLGTPIAVLVRNRDARSGDYAPGTYRPGHADRVWEDKYGVRDYRGGGRASGRETLARVIGGVIAEHILPETVHIVAFAHSIGDIQARDMPERLTRALVDETPVRCPDTAAAEQMRDSILAARESGDSLGGVIELRIDGTPVGLGEPVFRKAKALLASGIMSIGAVTGVTLGDAMADAALPGSRLHATGADELPVNAYGIQGGITNGGRITLRVTVKAPSTLGRLAKEGRHDPCIVPRVIPVIESMAALVLADLHLAARLNRAG
jgi:chorismate synthase